MFGAGAGECATAGAAVGAVVQPGKQCLGEGRIGMADPQHDNRAAHTLFNADIGLQPGLKAPGIRRFPSRDAGGFAAEQRGGEAVEHRKIGLPAALLPFFFEDLAHEFGITGQRLGSIETCEIIEIKAKRRGFDIDADTGDGRKAGQAAKAGAAACSARGGGHTKLGCVEIVHRSKVQDGTEQDCDRGDQRDPPSRFERY